MSIHPTVRPRLCDWAYKRSRKDEKSRASCPSGRFPPSFIHQVFIIIIIVIIIRLNKLYVLALKMALCRQCVKPPLTQTHMSHVCVHAHPVTYTYTHTCTHTHNSDTNRHRSHQSLNRSLDFDLCAPRLQSEPRLTVCQPGLGERHVNQSSQGLALSWRTVYQLRQICARTSEFVAVRLELSYWDSSLL